jgi:hypothetical protein
MNQFPPLKGHLLSMLGHSLNAGPHPSPYSRFDSPYFWAVLVSFHKLRRDPAKRSFGRANGQPARRLFAIDFDAGTFGQPAGHVVAVARAGHNFGTFDANISLVRKSVFQCGCVVRLGRGSA